MNSEDSTPQSADDDDVARLIQEELDPISMVPCKREALLRRILDGIGGGPPLPPVPPPKND